MNTCPECNTELLPFVTLSINKGELKICTDCFFKDIPKHPSFGDKDKEQKTRIREAAIEAKASYLLQKYSNANPR